MNEIFVGGGGLIHYDWCPYKNREIWVQTHAGGECKHGGRDGRDASTRQRTAKISGKPWKLGDRRRRAPPSEPQGSALTHRPLGRNTFLPFSSSIWGALFLQQLDTGTSGPVLEGGVLQGKEGRRTCVRLRHGRGGAAADEPGKVGQNPGAFRNGLIWETSGERHLLL